MVALYVLPLASLRTGVGVSTETNSGVAAAVKDLGRSSG